jgi:hypothetical protein
MEKEFGAACTLAGIVPFRVAPVQPFAAGMKHELSSWRMYCVAGELMGG